MTKIRTGYSFRVAAGKIEDIMSRLVECDYPVAPITDRASTFGFVRWNKLAQKTGLKPVFGVEIGVTDNLHAKKPAVDWWTFIAIDSLAPINRLVELATQQFRYEPLLSYDQAMAACDDAYVITGHRPNFQHIQPRQNLFVALGPSSSKGMIKRAVENGHSLLATSDNKFARQEDFGFYQITCGRGANDQTYDQHIQTNDEWRGSIDNLRLTDDQIEAAWQNRLAVMEGSNAKLETAKLLTPEKPKTLRQMCLEGAVEFGCDLSRPEYAERLDHELKLIEEKNFEDYFYIVADLCRYARQHMVVGPARGSSCGSLVCYLLNITTIDPIPYGLLFERFIDRTRNDLPDIDVDFSDTNRQMAINYLIQKYGSERVARLGTVAMFQPKSVLKEGGAALQLPKYKLDNLADAVVDRAAGDARVDQSLEDALDTTPIGQELLADYPEIRVLTRMEGHPRHYGQHAAGVVLAERPITDFVAVDHRTGGTMCDKIDAEAYNFLKIDVLGLTQLSVFEEALEMAGLDRNHLETIPLDDQAAFDVINQRRYSGIFQFNGAAVQSTARSFKFERFDDFVATTALARPGPMASGGTNEWISRRNGRSEVVYPHECFKPYLQDTLGIAIYQETVMQIGRHVGDLTWEQVTALRKAMSKSLGKEYFDQFGDPWKRGAIAKGVDPDVADRYWSDLCAMGGWAFNKSHSVAYGLISYWCAWLKAHHPFEFAAATLSHEPDSDNQIRMLREMAAEGYDYIPTHPDYGTDKWSVGMKDGKKCLVGPLSLIKGVGPKMVNSILGARARNERLPERAAKLLENPKTEIDSLFPIRDAFNRVLPDPSARNIHTQPKTLGELDQTEHDISNVLVFVTMKQITPRDENEAANVAKRGYEMKDRRTAYLLVRMADDTGVMLGKVNRFKFEDIGKPIVGRGRAGKALYAVKGSFFSKGSFRMINIDMVRYIGDIDE